MIMSNFTEDYLGNQPLALAAMIKEAKRKNWYGLIDDEMIYRQMASPEFRLYEEVVLCEVND